MIAIGILAALAGFLSGLVKSTIGLAVLLGMAAAYNASRNKGRVRWRAVSDGMFWLPAAGILAAEWVMRCEDELDRADFDARVAEALKAQRAARSTETEEGGAGFQ